MTRGCVSLLPLLVLAGCATAPSPVASSSNAPRPSPPPTSAAQTTDGSALSLAPAGSFTSGGLCAASTDPSYGHAKENAIAVGGDWFEGPRRADEYLGGLAGPTGQRITFHRNGSLVFRETILDEYEVSYEGLTNPIILYVDQYHFANLVAPAGLRCQRPIGLSRPKRGAEAPAK